MRKDFDPALVKEYLTRKYDSIEFTLADGISDYDLRDNETAAFENIPVYTTINIRTNENITIKLNSTDNRAITVVDNRPFELDSLVEITNIYITNNSGATATIKIIGVRKGV